VLQRGEYRFVWASVQYGAGVRALVTKLSIAHRMPLKQISRLFEDQYGYDRNNTTIEETF
jgi:transposase